MPFSILEMPRALGPRQPLDRFGDDSGSVSLGWVAPGVLYARVDGDLGDRLGASCAARLKRLLDESSSTVALFLDYWQLEAHSGTARDELVRALSPYRRRVTSVDLLARTNLVVLTARVFAVMLGGRVEVHTRAAEFAARLEQRAPSAGRVLVPSLRPLRQLPGRG